MIELKTTSHFESNVELTASWSVSSTGHELFIQAKAFFPDVTFIEHMQISQNEYALNSLGEIDEIPDKFLKELAARLRRRIERDFNTVERKLDRAHGHE